MTNRNILERLAGRVRRMLGGSPPSSPGIAGYALSADDLPQYRSDEPGDLETAFFNKTGRVAHKWVHFLPVYDRILAPFRGREIRFLEIGVSLGGSLELWRDYFGPDAKILGVDVNPECAERVDPPNVVRIGSQADTEFLDSVLAELGVPDIILDDGSHVANHQFVSFRHLFPKLADGGLYIIEDCHTAYWESFGGAYGDAENAIGLAKTLIDDLHGWYHDEGSKLAPREWLESVQVFDSVIVIQKRQRLRPGHWHSPAT